LTQAQTLKNETRANAAAEAKAFAEQLRAGEFGPALAWAKSLPSAAARDEALRQVAAAQAGAGARVPAVATTFEMSSDLARSAALKQLPVPIAARFGASSAENAAPPGNGGGSQADFDSLIELIITTVQPTSWKDNGGAGDVKGFEGGVYCDPAGTLKRRLTVDPKLRMAELQRAAQPAAPGGAKQQNALRKISLARLEAAVQRALAEGRPISEEQQLLAGLERIQYVFISPDKRDVVIAGPAAGWHTDLEGRVVGDRSQTPVLRLDDLVVVMRHMLSKDNATFGCSITPTKERLAATQEFLAASTQKPLKPGNAPREAWLKGLREQLGQQRIDIYGLDPQTRAARVLVEADYRMKLVGIGLEPSVLGVTNYLDSLVVPPGQAPPPLDVLRWWFAMNYDALAVSPDGMIFELRGQGVQVLSENELLDLQGERQHTGQSSDGNLAFTQSFTKHFGELCKKYPVYADLRNLFDLAMVGAIVRMEKLPERIEWHLTCFGPEGNYHPQQDFAPRWVDSVMNHRIVNKTQILVGVSGGVSANPWKFAQPETRQVDEQGKLTRLRNYHGGKAPLEAERWWWD